MLAARTRCGLFVGVVGEHTKHHRLAGVLVDAEDALRCGTADVIEMGRFTSNHRSDADDPAPVQSARQCLQICAERRRGFADLPVKCLAVLPVLDFFVWPKGLLLVFLVERSSVAFSSKLGRLVNFGRLLDKV